VNGHDRALDRVLYALFSRHADRRRHERDRRRYRATDLRVSFEVYLARVYGLSALAALAAAAAALAAGLFVPGETMAAAGRLANRSLPVVERFTLPQVPRVTASAGLALVAGSVAKRGTVAAGGRYLGLRARSRRAAIERSLPGAVRYLRALSAGSDDVREMLRKVAANREAYGASAVAMRRVLNRARLTGNLRAGLRGVARDTPSRDLLAPFLLKFREHAEQGPDELDGYLEMESRMLGQRRARTRERAASLLELVGELFVVLLVLPALLVVVVTVMGVLAPGLSAPVATPFGDVTVRALVHAGAGAFILLVGLAGALVVESVRPAALSSPSYGPPGGLDTLRTATSNPASAALVGLPFAVGVAGGLHSLGYRPANVALLAYVAYGLPVGAVAVRRARVDAAKDRELVDAVHAIAGHVGLGRPFGEAVELVAREVEFGALESDVADLALNTGLTTGPPGGGASEAGTRADGGGEDLRTAALRRFVDAVGTPLAEQTMGLVSGALAVGSDADAVFETLQAEVGRLHHEKKSLRSDMLVYVAVGWTTALLVVGIVVAVNAYVLEGFAQLKTVSGTSTTMALAPDAVDPERDRYRFYLVTQATMLASGWFAGAASRGRYEALLHSAGLVLVAYVVFAGAGML
jgi:hypothetical protein